MEVLQNTLYVVTRGASIRRDHLTLRVFVDRTCRLVVPIHGLDGAALFGQVHVTPSALQLCAEHGVAVSFLTESGRLLSRVAAPGSGNVLVRRTQFRWADSPECRAGVAKYVVAGKVQNARNVLVRGAREASDESARLALARAAERLGRTLGLVAQCDEVDSIRGHEGEAAAAYFEAFGGLIRQQRHHFRMQGRTRRPPRDAVNALLSFVYALLLADCTAALATAGLDPDVGFLHVDRPGRPGLALDLMEEFRPLIADRLVLTLINRQQVKPEGFTTTEGGGVRMDEVTRREVLNAYQRRKREEVTHPLLEHKTTVGRLPFLQGRILARHLRGDLPVYVPCVLKN